MDIAWVLRKLRPILGDERVNQYEERLHLMGRDLGRVVEVSLRRQLQRATDSLTPEREILLDPLPEGRASGSFRLGSVSYGKRPLHPFCLRPEELIQHTGIFGRSGAGKTNVAFLLLRQLAIHGIPFLVFDWKKNYRDLLALKRFRNLVVYTVGRDHAPFFFNPLVPPRGVEPREWLKKLVEIMQHAFFLGHGVAYVLQEVIDRLYRERGIYRGSGEWPTFRDVRAALESRKVKGREASWMESTLRAVAVLTFGATDRVLNTGGFSPLERLLARQAVLELDALTHPEKTFLIEALLLWIHHYRMNEPARERLKHVLLIEEAHHILLRKKQELIGAETVTDVLLREVRELGVGIMIVDQLPALLSKPALENTFTTIAMNLKEKGDVTAAAKAMLLEPDEARYLGHLPVGGGIVKLQARWTRPFLARFPLLKVRKGDVTDARVRQRWEGVEDPAAREKEVHGNSAQDAVPDAVASRSSENEVTGDLAELLKDVRDVPLCRITERYARLGLNPKQGKRTVSELVRLGYLTAVDVPYGGTYLRLLDLTAPARRALELPEESPRHGGVEHRFWIETLWKALDGLENVIASKEYGVGDGKTVDLMATERGGRKTAIEIETGKSDWEANVRKCLGARIDRILVAVTRASVFKEISAALAASEFPDSVKVVRAEEFLRRVREHAGRRWGA